MTRYGSPSVEVALFDGRSIIGTLAELEFDKEAVVEDVTVLGDDDEQWAAVGLKRGSLRQRGFFDDAANSVHDHLVALTQRTAVICLEGNTFSKRFVGWAGAITTHYRRIATKGELHKAEGDYQVTGQVEEGIILAAHTAVTADPGTNPSIDNGASSANGGSGYFELSALTLGGYTNFVAKVRHSTDNSVFVDLITFTAATSAPTGQRLTVAGTVNRYTRAEWDFTGAGSGQSATPFIGFGRN